MNSHSDHVLATRLKEATSKQHRMLDQHPVLSILVRGKEDHQALRQALLALYGGFQVLETISGAGSGSESADGQNRSDLFYDYRPRADLLRQDLTNIPPALQHWIQDHLQHSLCGSCPEQYVGIIYVLEGSRQGGRWISQSLHKRFSEQRPPAFFTVDEQHLEKEWQDFWDFARHHVRTDSQIEGCLQTARSAFQCFIDCADFIQRLSSQAESA